MFMKKFLVVLLAACLVLALCCCAQTPEVEDFSLTYDTEVGEIDLNGYKCEIRTSDLDIFHYKEETELGDAVLARFRDIESEYNCTITMTKGDNRLKGTVVPVLVGNNIAEIGHDTTPQEIITSFPFYHMEYVDTIDMTDYAKYGSAQFNTVGMYQGERYSVAAYQWPGKQMTYTYNIFEISGNNIKKFGLTDPRDIYENGMWTWDWFEQNIDGYTIDDGDKHIPAMNITWTLYQMLLYTNGVQLSVKSDSGTYTCGYFTKEAMDAMDFEARLFREHKGSIVMLGYSEMTDAFIHDELMLSTTSFSHLINDTIFEVDNYGVVPYPCGPAGEYGKNGGAISDTDSFMIFNTAHEPDAAGFVINLLCEPFEAYNTPEKLRNYARTIFYDERDVDWFLKYRDYVTYSYTVTDFGNIVKNIETALRAGKGSAETIEKYSDMLETAYEKVILPNEVACEEKWSR